MDRKEVRERQARALDSMERRIAREAHLFQEAWFNHFGLTRFLRFILTILIAFIAATAFVQTSERDGCRRRQPEFEAMAHFIYTAYQNKYVESLTASERGLRLSAAETVRQYAREYHAIETHIVHNCDRVYPILPFNLFNL